MDKRYCRESGSAVAGSHGRVGLCIAISLAWLAAALFPASVCAHAILIASSPKDTSILSVAPNQAVLRFNARIEKGISQVTLTTGSGRKITLPTAQKTDEPPDQLTIPLPPLKPGTYRLQYRILATDGHATPGLITFTIAGSGPR